MGTIMKIVGICPYCNRHVSKDLRPINVLSASDAKRISQLVHEEPPLIQLDSQNEIEEHPRKEQTAHEDPRSKKEVVGTSKSKKSRVSKKKKTIPDKSQSEVPVDASPENSLNALTENILDVVENEFEGDRTIRSSVVLRENAEVILAMLAEEKRIIDEIEMQATPVGHQETKDPPAKRRRC
ncbi:uncharacterized protein LOC122320758 [Drosophila ficusphila]|uniref:uncharacterized protein LOC122320758 n=1 Tax=Drosophila ficusphila TaxID=30025 RepID=UPI001C89ABE8|nr:uncharacterized protein LOC122320758 [Drosophila ficusphila]